jgi:hypothetical protein
MPQDRQQLINQAQAAETSDQIKAAKVDMEGWHAAHPEDHHMNRLLGD